MSEITSLFTNSKITSVFSADVRYTLIKIDSHWMHWRISNFINIGSSTYWLF
jgi:hypothetical protein